jgi:hypothetical protein
VAAAAAQMDEDQFIKMIASWTSGSIGASTIWRKINYIVLEIGN